MALKVVWSNEAKESLKKIITYLEENWTRRELSSFARILEKQLSIISNKPKCYKKSERLLGTRECLLTKHNSLFYTFDNENVFVVTLWDNRQEPGKLRGKIAKL
ncbi:MAG: type II toxin-antitoxin system RelE/ParE family toxin [Bacteroidia bacterium]